MALVSSYQGFIFDYGGVLVRHQTEEDRTRLAELAGIPRSLFSELYWANRMAYDKDLVSAAEYWTGVAQDAGVKLSADAIAQLTELDTKSWMQFDSVMWDWVNELRAAGKRVAMLSNMPRDLGEALKTRTNRLADFDHVTLSYEVRAAKPEPAAYENCLEGLGTPADQVLFLDDRIENLQGAELLGIRGIQFIDRDQILLRVRS
ncbi:MAG: HAD family phosphatase [Acidobacteriaceae bacterium]|nr:HAD family phosphatase [Acidobacteriaceae bacterium]